MWLRQSLTNTERQNERQTGRQTRSSRAAVTHHHDTNHHRAAALSESDCTTSYTHTYMHTYTHLYTHTHRRSVPPAHSDPAHVAALEVACLRCLYEVVALCWRAKALPHQLMAIQAVVLDNLLTKEACSTAQDAGTLPSSMGAAGVSVSSTQPSGSDGAAAADGGAAVLPAGALADSVIDVAAYAALGITSAVPSGVQPRPLAAKLLGALGAFTCDVATVQHVMEGLYGYLDERHRWQERAVVRVRVVRHAGSSQRHDKGRTHLRGDSYQHTYLHTHTHTNTPTQRVADQRHVPTCVRRRCWRCCLQAAQSMRFLHLHRCCAMQAVHACRRRTQLLSWPWPLSAVQRWTRPSR